MMFMTIFQSTFSKYKILLLAMCLFILPNALVRAQIDPAQLNIANDNIALQGYDPVSYFQEKPTKGKSNIKLQLDGINYLFSSLNNKKQFEENPKKFIPQYGGWCAYAMGKTGEKVEVNPKTFKVLNGKLYLFYNKFFTNTLDTWNEDEQNLKVKADKNWQTFIK